MSKILREKKKNYFPNIFIFEPKLNKRKNKEIVLKDLVKILICVTNYTVKKVSECRVEPVL